MNVHKKNTSLIMRYAYIARDSPHLVRRASMYLSIRSPSYKEVHCIIHPLLYTPAKMTTLHPIITIPSLELAVARVFPHTAGGGRSTTYPISWAVQNS